MKMLKTSPTSNGLLFPLKLYFDGAYYLGFCPFKLVRNDMSATNNNVFYATKRDWQHTLYSAFVSSTIVVAFIGYGGLLVVKHIGTPKTATKFFDLGVLIFHTIAMLLHIHQFWFNEAACVKIFNFISDPKHLLPGQADNQIYIKNLKYFGLAYFIGILLASGMEPGFLGTVRGSIFQSKLENLEPPFNTVFSIFIQFVEIETYVPIVITTINDN